MRNAIAANGYWYDFPKDGSLHWEAVEYAERQFEDLVRFTLVYQGPLLAKQGSAKGRMPHEHAIRQQFQRQLSELSNFQFPLTHLKSALSPYVGGPGRTAHTVIETLIVQKGPFRFLPLISTETGLVCKLDILFLRPSNPGEIVTHGGDLDNRLKTLFDALRIPSEIPEDQKVEDGEDPFYCLLQDDALITEVNVATDRLLERRVKDDIHHVLLIIGVETLIANPVQVDRWLFR